MSVDPYSLCPGGTGKKLKFCCSDLLHELGKIDHMLAAEQRQACLDYIAQLEGKFPDRACLLTTKALVLHSLERKEEAQKAAERVLATQPTNPVALAARALALIDEDDPRDALRPLHQSLVACGTQVPQRVFDTVGLVADALLAEGYITAAYAHSVWQLQVKPDYEPALLIAYRIQSSQDVPLPLKDIRHDFSPAPDGAAYQAEFDAALAHANAGHWLSAAEAFDALMFRAAPCAALWHNLGVLRAYLANEAGAAEALRRYASLNVPPDDAVEAEMLALVLDPKISEATVEQMRLRYQPGDLEAVHAALAASPLSVGESIEGMRSDDPDEPPPRAVFSVLDRPLPPAGPDLTIGQLPISLGYALLYGRQTDREPRLELFCKRPRVEQAKAALHKIVGDALGHPVAEEVAGFLPLQPFSEVENPRLPRGVLPEQMLRLSTDLRRKHLFDEWPDKPSFVFGGKTPRQAASDRASRVAVLAAIGLWELNYGHAIDFNELRRTLDLPVAEDIDPNGIDVEALPLVRLHRLDVKKLSDEQLSYVWRRAAMFRARLACVRIGPEVIARESLPAAERAQAEGVLAGFANDFAKGLEHLAAARKLAKTAGISCAGWDLEELSMRFSAGRIDGFMELVQHISSAHRNEPGVQERLFQFLYEVGFIDEQGRPVRPAAAPSTSDLVVPGGAAAEAGKIWTPDSEAGEKKSALWVPGT